MTPAGSQDRRLPAGKGIPTVPLMLLQPGVRARIVGVCGGGHGLRRRLCDLGLVPGQEVSVASGPRPGAVIIERDGCRIALGRGMCHRILVQPLE